MEPLVSILIPAFNAQAWIADTLKSALGQTWRKKEIILVDDGSTDQTLAIARRFASGGVRMVSQANQGAAAARNKAWALSQGDYIQWLDADDLLAPDKIARQIQALEYCPGRRTLFSCAWGQFRHRPATARFTPTPLWCDLSPMEWMVRKWGQNLYMQPAAWLVSRELTQAAGPWNALLSLDDDGEYFCRVILASDGIRFVPEARVFYRQSGFSSLSSVGCGSRKLDSQLLSMRLQITRLRASEDSERVRLACLKCLQGWMFFFYPHRPELVAQLRQIAVELGGQLELPQLPWKYAWIQKAFGWTAARQTQICYNRLKASLIGAWDRALLRLENRAL